MFNYQPSISLASLVNQAVWSIKLNFNITFYFPSFLTFLKNDGKENNDKGELINRTAWFTRLYIYISG